MQPRQKHARSKVNTVTTKSWQYGWRTKVCVPFLGKTPIRHLRVFLSRPHSSLNNDNGDDKTYESSCDSAIWLIRRSFQRLIFHVHMQELIYKWSFWEQSLSNRLANYSHCQWVPIAALFHVTNHWINIATTNLSSVAGNQMLWTCETVQWVC